MTSTSTKRCYICKQHKDISLFHKNSRTKSGLAASCKECKNKEAREYYQTPEGHKKRREQSDRWRRANLERHRKKVREWKKKNPETREKLAQRGREWRAKNPHKALPYLLKKYGLTVESYNALKEKQNGACAICGQKSKKLFIDHCHKTQRVRGLLCQQHNTGLGLFGDDDVLIRKALEYLTRT